MAYTFLSASELPEALRQDQSDPTTARMPVLKKDLRFFMTSPMMRGRSVKQAFFPMKLRP